jgi:hypothetical protein
VELNVTTITGIIGRCQDLILDGSLSYGNPFLEYHWDVEPLTPTQLDTIRLKRTSYILQNPKEVISVRVEMNGTVPLCIDELEIYSVNGTDDVALTATAFIDSPTNELSTEYSLNNINDGSYHSR